MLTATPAPPAPGTLLTRPRWQRAGAGAQLGVLIGVHLRTHVANRRLLALNLCQPLILLVLFTQVFGSIANPAHFPPGVSYLDYLLPALLVTTGLGPATNSGAGLVRDMTGGFLTRVRSLPVNPAWVLVARSVGDLARVLAQLVVLVGGAVLLFGFAPAGGLLNLAAAALLAGLVCWALIWLFLALGAWLRDVEVMQSIGVVSVFPLMFASSAFVPVHVLPGWLGAIAVVNPMSHAIDASRELTLGLAGGDTVAVAVVASAVLLVLALGCAVHAFRRPLVS